MELSMQTEISRPQQLPQYVRQDPAVLVVVDFNRGVDPQDQTRVVGRAIGPVYPQRHRHPRPDSSLEPDDVERLRAVEVQRGCGLAFFELTGQHAHTNKIAPMYSLEALRYDSLHAEQ